MIEARLDKGRGPLATVLVQRGTLKVGDVFVAGATAGKVRALTDSNGKQVKEAGPSFPVEVLGLSSVPSAGDPLTVVENEARAREVAVYRQGLLDTKRTTSAPVSLENMFADRSSKVIEFPIVIRGDVQGSTEAIVNAVNRISTDEIKVRVLSAGRRRDHRGRRHAGQCHRRADHRLQRPSQRQGARSRSTAHKVELRYYDVIYHLTDWVREAMAGELGPEIIETVVGRAEVKDVFPAGKRDKAAGLLVLEGVMRKGLHARLTREDVIVSRRRPSPRCAASRTTSPKSAPAWSAACCWPTPTTSRPATTSKCSKSRNARARCS